MRERLADMFARRVRFGVCFACLCCIFVTRCATTRGAGAERAETIAAKTETVKQIIETSNLSPEQKKIAFEVLDSIAIDTHTLGQDVDHNKEIADSNAVAASRWRWMMWIAGFCGVGLIVFGVKRFLL
jgi:hypothetical protein